MRTLAIWVLGEVGGWFEVGVLFRGIFDDFLS